MLASLAVCLALAEGVLRVLESHAGERGRRLYTRLLRDDGPSLAQLDATLAAMQTKAPRYVYDGDLGWVTRPFATWQGDRYAADAEGARVAAPGGAHAAAPGDLRIAIFGDSFTWGYGVAHGETWGAVLEHALRAAGVPASVRNFGVGGYGMDQAWLRFRKEAPVWRPQHVVFGLQPENARRNLNLIRPLYQRNTNAPFSKPRFLREKGALRLLNHPALPPDALPALLADFERWPFAPYEAFYTPVRRDPPAMPHLVALLSARLAARPDEMDALSPGTEGGDLARAIVDGFAADVAASGARFHVLLLPTRALLAGREDAEPLRRLLAALSARHDVVDPSEDLAAALREQGAEAFFADGGHYAAVGHRIAGEALAAHWSDVRSGAALMAPRRRRRPVRTTATDPGAPRARRSRRVRWRSRPCARRGISCCCPS